MNADKVKRINKEKAGQAWPNHFVYTQTRLYAFCGHGFASYTRTTPD